MILRVIKMSLQEIKESGNVPAIMAVTFMDSAKGPTEHHDASSLAFAVPDGMGVPPAGHKYSLRSVFASVTPSGGSTDHRRLCLSEVVSLGRVSVKLFVRFNASSNRLAEIGQRGVLEVIEEHIYLDNDSAEVLEMNFESVSVED